MKSVVFSLWLGFSFSLVPARAEPIPLASSWWRDPEFTRSFFGLYQPDTRTEPFIRDAERGHLQAVQQAMSAGNLKGAIADLKATPLLGESAALSYNLGVLLIQDDQLDAAIDPLGKALKAFPNFRRAYAALGLVYVRKEAWDEARVQLIRAVELGDQSGTTFGYLGHCYLKGNRPKSALEAFRRAALTMPDTVDWQLGEAQCHLALGEAAPARALFAEALEARPEEAAIWSAYASSLQKLGQSEEAAAALETAVRLGDRSGDTLKWLGDLYRALGNTSLAESRSLEALSGRPPLEAKKAIELAEAAISREDRNLTQKLVAALEKREDAGESAGLARVKLLLAIEEKADDATRAALEALVKQAPTDGLAILALAKIRTSEGHHIEADLLYDQAKRLSNQEYRACLEHGKALVARAAWEDALINLRRAQVLQADPILEDYLRQVEKAQVGSTKAR